MGPHHVKHMRKPTLPTLPDSSHISGDNYSKKNGTLGNPPLPSESQFQFNCIIYTNVSSPKPNLMSHEKSHDMMLFTQKKLESIQFVPPRQGRIKSTKHPKNHTMTSHRFYVKSEVLSLASSNVRRISPLGLSSWPSLSTRLHLQHLE